MNEAKKNVIWNAIGTTLNAFNSLFFMIIVTRINGVSNSGLFTLAFSLACLFCLFAGYEGRVFQVTDIHGEFSDREYICHRYITSFLAILIVLAYAFFMQYDSYQLAVTFLLCLMKILEMLADVYYGILQKNEKLYIVGYSLSIKSTASLILFILTDLITKNMLLSCFVLDLVWLLFLLFYDIPKTKRYVSNDSITFKNVLKLFKSGFFAFTILFLAIYLVNAPKYALDGRVDSSLQAIFGIVLMPATFLSLAVQYVIQPILNRLANYFRLKEKREFNKLVFLVVTGIFIFGLFVMIVAYFLGVPVLNVLYGIDISKYNNHLMIILAGATLYSISTLLSASLTTVRYTFVQFVVFVIASLFALIVSPLLINRFSIFGASLAYFLIMVLQLFLYLASYMIIMKRIKF